MVRSGSSRTVQTDESHGIRDQINLRLRDALESCQQAGESMTVFYTYGGYQSPLNLLREFFDLRNTYHISPSKVLDGLDRAIGEYQRRKNRLYWQMFNPFFWLYSLLVKVIGIPFRILGAAGFDEVKIERSRAGKVVKAIVGFVVTFILFMAALLTILQILGWLDPTIKFIHAVERH